MSARYQVQVVAGPRWEVWQAPGEGRSIWGSEEEATAAAEHEEYGVAVTDPGVTWRVVEVAS